MAASAGVPPATSKAVLPVQKNRLKLCIKSCPNSKSRQPGASPGLSTHQIVKVKREPLPQPEEDKNAARQQQLDKDLKEAKEYRELLASLDLVRDVAKHRHDMFIELENRHDRLVTMYEDLKKQHKELMAAIGLNTTVLMTVLEELAGDGKQWNSGFIQEYLKVPHRYLR
jgi:hypothetical protein